MREPMTKSYAALEDRISDRGEFGGDVAAVSVEEDEDVGGGIGCSTPERTGAAVAALRLSG